MEAHPPRVSTIFRLIAYSAALVFCFPWLLTLPLLIYVALFHTVRLLGFIAGTYGALVSDLRIVLGICAFIGLGLVLGIYSYLSGLRARKKFQKHPVASVEDNELPPDRSVELPPPTLTPPSSVILRGYRSVVGFIFAELGLLFASYAIYFLWSDTLFRWPPNPNLQACTVGTALALFLLGSGLTWRLGGKVRMIADDFGITVPNEGDSDAVVYWSEVRHLVLVPVVTPDRQKQPVPAEVYHVLAAPEAEPIELGRFAKDDGTPHIFSSAREEADSAALRQRERLLAPEIVTRRQRLWYWGLSLVTAAFLGIAVFIPIHDATRPSYRPVTGQVAVYQRTSKQITLRLKGDSHEYWVFPNGTWPDMPDTLPNGNPVPMMARDDNIGRFDAITSTQQWHVVTRGYAEPWTLWADDALWEFGLLYLSAGMIIALARDIKGQRKMAKARAIGTSAEKEQA